MFGDEGRVRAVMSAMRRARRIEVAAGGVLLSLVLLGAPAQARVSLPSPGVMRVDGFPAELSAGEAVLYRDRMPLTVHDGTMFLQMQSPTDGWHTVASGMVHSRAFRFVWRVPVAGLSSEVSLRFVLERKHRTLAASPPMTVAVAVGVAPPDGVGGGGLKGGK